MWTPPHCWALALFVKTDYANAGVPMMPVVAGERSTRRQVFLYTIPMAVCAVLPWLMQMTGMIYGITALVLSGVFAALALRVAMRTTGVDDNMGPEKALFGFSIVYLFALFGALAVDRLVMA